MAPWNLVFQGPKMAYIDYDTKQFTFDKLVPKVYQIMSVLFNYKRTVEDFKRCLPKGHNDYGFSHISDCVGGKMGEIFKKKGGKKCKESSHQVPCGDGSCQTDYISCLKVMSKIELSDDIKSMIKGGAGGGGAGGGKVSEKRYVQGGCTVLTVGRTRSRGRGREETP